MTAFHFLSNAALGEMSKIRRRSLTGAAEYESGPNELHHYYCGISVKSGIKFAGSAGADGCMAFAASLLGSRPKAYIV